MVKCIGCLIPESVFWYFTGLNKSEEYVVRLEIFSNFITQ